MSLFSNALLFFIITNPIGNAPAILAIVKDYDFHRQRQILLREGIVALIFALFFQYFGEFFLTSLGIETYSLTLCGGILLLLIALSMLFPNKEAHGEIKAKKSEPFIVPIAMPLISGPGLMTMIMIKSKLSESNLLFSLSIMIAFVGVIGVMVGAPYLLKLIGKRGLDALEQVMGMILSLMAVEMLVNGGRMFVETLSKV